MEISSRDLTKHHLTRLDRFDAKFDAFVAVTAEHTIVEATLADERIAHIGRSPLLGLPLGIKDLCSTVGVRTEFGPATSAKSVPTDDTRTVGLLQQVVEDKDTWPCT